ncbi:hypothetical protein [Curtobacterium sp. Leaf261]|uniref:hypothetical protein n=1 Tax=Curtobacterium sp. Leaf261 TaxID=1736311 RepID=UPI0006FB0DF2|nr:hypothetical protein [Curtobacterium sp. Leaf261]KQO65097.1 hypothetical protein ASF23_02950 [Curtobacterium sp. Leaf261]
MDEDEHAAALRRRALTLLRVVPLGTRVVVRMLDGGGARDALGDLVGRTETTCTVRTKRDEVEVDLDAVVAAKQVPPPPAPRPRRRAS